MKLKALSKMSEDMIIFSTQQESLKKLMFFKVIFSRKILRNLTIFPKKLGAFFHFIGLSKTFGDFLIFSRIHKNHGKFFTIVEN